MTKLNNTLFLFIIIALEGYIILSAELLAIRQTIPFVGSGTDSVSVIIASVLMPLAFGYHSGGQFNVKNSKGKFQSIRKKLLSNILIASAFLLPALSYFIFQFFFIGLEAMGIENNILKIFVYCLVFLVTPMYLLGQTIPLVSNYFSKKKLSEVTGRMLFISTMGSFCGSLVTTLFLMQVIGAHHTVTVLFALLLSLSLIIGNKQTRDTTMIMLAITGLAVMLNSDSVMKTLKIVKNNKYSTIMVMNIEEDGDAPHLFINNNDSSMYSKEGKKHEYVEFLESITIDSIPEGSPPKDILIIGAGGFTFGHNKLNNNYIYIDIDKDLKEVSEKYLLKEKLQDNKTFFPVPARAYLARTDKKFDIILLDAYLGGLSIPEHLVTKEFFLEIKEHLNEDAILIANFIVSPNFNNTLSKNIDNTLRSVFPYLSRRAEPGKQNMWSDSQTKSANHMYIYKHHSNFDAGSIYKDTAN
ncbi:MAG: spermidine synthase [Alphaproteobacteria bacterium]